MLYVGRVSKEKSIEDFLRLNIPGTKIIVGDGPYRAHLEAEFPKAVFLGYRKGEGLAECYANADLLVFPSKTDTFGLVMIEALACGVPVAGYPVVGPIDIITDDRVGALDNDLGKGVEMALSRANREECIRVGRTYTWDSCTDQLLSHLVPATFRLGGMSTALRGHASAGPTLLALSSVEIGSRMSTQSRGHATLSGNSLPEEIGSRMSTQSRGHATLEICSSRPDAIIPPCPPNLENSAMPLDWAPFVDFVDRHQRFLIMTHVRPDGDALGSEAALADALRLKGKSARAVVASGISPRYAFLDPDKSRFERFIPPGDSFRDVDAVIIIDTGTWNQIGEFGDFLKTLSAARAVIDHHRTQDDLGVCASSTPPPKPRAGWLTKPFARWVLG